MSKIVVVGANHAGTACINTMLDNFGNENEIVVFDQNSNISFLGCGMALWIGEQIDGAEGLFYSDKEKLEAKGAKVYMNSPVLSIDYDNKVVTAEVEGKEHKESYEKLIFATGSTPILPPIEGVEIVKGNREFKATLENVQFVKLYQNAEEVINKLSDKSQHLDRIAVVGGGYIGVELAEAFERLGKEVVLVDIVDTVLNGYYDKDKLEAKGAKVYMNSPVLSIDYDNKVVTAEVEGKEHKESYEKLIFATGSTPILPPIEGVEIVKGNREFKATLENVQFVKLYQNAEEVINKLSDKSQHLNRIAVVGGGYIGVELAEAFERLGKEVVLVDIVDTVLNGYYDKDFTQMMAKNLEDHNIRLALGQTVKAIEGDGKVERLITDKESFDVDMVILAVGFRPNTALADGKIELFRNGAFLVDKKQETSIPGVYAVGDCATVYDNARKDTSYIALASNAVRTGIVGAYNACGHELEGIGVQGSNGISIYGLHMVSTGLTLEKAKAAGYNATETGFNDLQKPEFMKHDNHEVAIKIVFDKDSREILGAQMVSHDIAISMGIHMFSLAIQEHVTIDKLALTDLFFLPHFNKPYNYITMAALTAEK
ncbi:NADH oxidase [Streptococcus pneumoniae]|nr:NADH oxidase [Streptococcus pneumoniae]